MPAASQPRAEDEAGFALIQLTTNGDDSDAVAVVGVRGGGGNGAYGNGPLTGPAGFGGRGGIGRPVVGREPGRRTTTTDGNDVDGDGGVAVVGAVAGETSDARAEVMTMPIWYQPKHPDREAARLDAEGHIILAFGQHRGRPLDALPECYLRWLSEAEDFAPAELRRRAAALLEGNQEQAVAQEGPPDLRRRDEVMAWAATADPAEVADLSRYLSNLAGEIETKTAGG